MVGSILIVEDDADIGELIKLYLTKDGFAAQVVPSGEAAMTALREADWDLVLLDVNLPGIDGFEVLQDMRRSSDVPVILVTARQEEMDAIFGLGAGADEYVTKPFSPRVLVARVRALLRRTQERAVPSEDVGHGVSESIEATRDPSPDSVVWLEDDICVKLETAQVFRANQELALAPREFGVLRYLIEQDGRPVSPQEIYKAVWGNEYGDISSVAVHVQRLRRKLEEDPAEPRLIITRHGYGYLVKTSSVNTQRKSE